MDESQVEIDQVNVTNAQAAVNDATLKAPTGGIVEEVNVTTGEQIASGGTGGASSGSSGSATHAVVIITPGVFEVTGSVSDTLVNEIAVGQPAEVVAAGSSEAVAGQGHRGCRGGDGHVWRCKLPGDGRAQRREPVAAAGNVRLGERGHQPGHRRHHRAHQCGAHDGRRAAR